MSVIANLAPVIGAGLVALSGYISVRRMHRRVRQEGAQLEGAQGEEVLIQGEVYRQEYELPLHLYVPTVNVTGTFGSNVWGPGGKIEATSPRPTMQKA